MNNQSFEFPVLEIASLTDENLDRIIAYAKRFGIQTIFHMTTEWDKYQVLDHSFWGVPPVDEEALAFMENHQNELRHASEKIHAAGMKLYLWRREIRMPVGFVNKVGAEWVDFDNPELWNYLKWNLTEIFRLFPLVSGLVLTCTGEQKEGEWITANGIGGQLPLDIRFEKMFRTCFETCRALGKEIIFRNHGAGDDGISLAPDANSYMPSFLQAAGRVSPELTIMGKGVESDFQPGYPLNFALREMAHQQPTLMELSLPMEYNNVSKTPFSMAEEIRYRLHCARQMGCRGVVARVDWHACEHQNTHSWSCIGTVNELNLYAFCRFINDPGVSTGDVTRDFCVERYGKEAAPVAEELYRGLYEAGCKTYYELGQHVTQTPSGALLPPGNVLSMLQRGELFMRSLSPKDFAINEHSLCPDQSFIDAVGKEKEDAAQYYEQSLALLEKNAALFSEEDYQQWSVGLKRIRRDARIRQYSAQATYYWIAFLRNGNPENYDHACTLIDRVQPLLEEYRERYAEIDNDPTFGLSVCFATASQNTITKLRQELEAARLYWQNSGVSAEELSALRCPGLFNGIQVSGKTVALTIDNRHHQLVSLQLNGATWAAQNKGLFHLWQGCLLNTEFGFERYQLSRLANNVQRLEILFSHFGVRIAIRWADDLPACSFEVTGENFKTGGQTIFPWLNSEKWKESGKQTAAADWHATLTGQTVGQEWTLEDADQNGKWIFFSDPETGLNPKTGSATILDKTPDKNPVRFTLGFQ